MLRAAANALRRETTRPAKVNLGEAAKLGKGERGKWKEGRKREEGGERTVFVLVSQICSSASRTSGGSPGQPSAPGTAPSPAPSLVLASSARSPLLALPLPASPPANQPGRALPRLLPLPPPHTSCEQETRGPADSDQVGEAQRSRPVATYPLRQKLVAHREPTLLPSFVGWESSRNQGTHKITAL